MEFPCFAAAPAFVATPIMQIRAMQLKLANTKSFLFIG
jgi:hypothetical protein